MTKRVSISANTVAKLEPLAAYFGRTLPQLIEYAVACPQIYWEMLAEVQRLSRGNEQQMEREAREKARADRAGHAEARRQVAADKAKEREQARAARAEARDKEQAEVAERRAARKLRQEAIAKAKATGLTRRKADAVIGRFYQTWSPAHVRPQDTDQCRHLARSYTSEAFQLDAQRYNDACLVFYGTTQQRSAKDLMRTWVLELQQQIQQALSH